MRPAELIEARVHSETGDLDGEELPAIGDLSNRDVVRLQEHAGPGVFLQANDITVGQVSDCGEFFTIKVAGFGMDTRLDKFRWPQKTADARRRNGGSIGR